MPIYDSVNGVARKVIKIYDSVGGVARSVTKSYDSVNGVARLSFSSRNAVWKKYSCERFENEDGSEYYSKGSYYGTVVAPTGELPEEGTLIEGSIEEGYCILQIDTTTYYYELEG